MGRVPNKLSIVRRLHGRAERNPTLARRYAERDEFSHVERDIKCDPWTACVGVTVASVILSLTTVVATLQLWRAING